MSTLADVPSVDKGGGSHWLRRAGLMILLVIVVLGAFGVFGVHSATQHSRADGYTLTVTYPQTARAGLDIPFRVRVHRDGGVNSEVTLAISEPYFRIFETQGFYPDADSSTNDGRFVYFDFSAPPAGQDFVMEYDAYIQPASQIGKKADIQLIIKGRLITQTSIHTWLVP